MDIISGISGTFEIVKSMDDKAKTSSLPKMGSGYSIEDDINRLFEAINVSSAKGVGLSNDRGKEILRKRASKRPIRAGSSQSMGIGISEPVSLKQALRGLCISQASELAAMKRLPKQGGCSGSSEVGTVKRLYRSVVVEANRSSLPLNDDGGNLVEISLVPERISSVSPDSCQSSHLDKAESSDQSAHNSQDHMTCSNIDSAVVCNGDSGVNESEKITSVAVEVSEEASIPENQKNYQDAASSLSNSKPNGLVRAFPSNSSSLIKPIFRLKNFSRRKVKQDLSTTSSNCTTCNEEVENCLKPESFDSGSCASNHARGIILEDGAHSSPASSCVDNGSEVNSSKPDTSLRSTNPSSTIIGIAKSMLAKIDERSTVKDKGDFSQSSNSSIGEYSCSTSEASSSNGSSCCSNRPHMSRDLRWEAIHQIEKQHGYFSLKHFKLVKKLGCGDIGSVYLAELSGTNCLFALKVMDDESLANRKKTSRAQTEKDILQMLDHPFLPTLYGHFVLDKLSCLVMEYCPGGDLHMLRQKQPGRSFSEQAVRFYAAEVLLAIEYLHMLGVVYRDLKPENVLVREDGHIMLSDFDLSLRCSVNPVVVQSSSPATETTGKASIPCSESICIQPFCLHPAWQVSCFGPKLLSVTSRSRKLKSDLAAQIIPLPQLVAEPTSARSNSFVGTYEYLAPEIVKNEGHGSAVDWWMFGIFLFELLYGKTPFKGSGNDETLSNVVSQSLKFPSGPIVSLHARDLIRGLLVKEPENRLGSEKGAAEIKQHSFFDGLNWALIRCAVPPELPKPSDTGMVALTTFSLKKDSAKCQEFTSTAENTAFEMF